MKDGSLKNNKRLADTAKSELLRLISLFVILNIVTYFVNPNVYSSADKIKLLINNCTVLGSSILSLVIISLIRIGTQPIKLVINIENKISGKQFTQIIHNDPQKTEGAFTAVMNIEFIRTNSPWNWLAKKIMLSKNVSIHIFDSEYENQSVIICQPTNRPEEITLVNKGFVISFNKYINNYLINNAGAKKDYEWVIIENKDVIAHATEDIPIVPIVQIGSKPPGFLMKKFIFECQFMNDAGCHTVNFFKE